MKEKKSTWQTGGTSMAAAQIGRGTVYEAGLKERPEKTSVNCQQNENI